ncbi:MAG: hypothetical protein OEY03_08330 [Rhizobacter sp.]|nr:hypothetical protein [Rhizobacter sp.]
MLKGLFVRPLGLQKRGNQFHVVLVDRRRAPQTAEQELSKLRADLRARLLTHEHGQTAQVMRHLAFVHDELGRTGWSGLEELPGPVIRLALVQAEMLASRDPSPSLETIVERLRVLKVAAGMREERQLRLQNAGGRAGASGAESSRQALDETERSWVGTVPVGVVLPNRDE